MPFFTQNRFPALWDCFQYFFGGVVAKRRICLGKYASHRRILEVGCSLGNIAKVFMGIDGVEYTGIDIDSTVIAHARRKFAQIIKFTFSCDDIECFAKRGDEFDFILFAGVCHHVEDDLCKKMLNSAIQILADDGVVIVVDPLLPSSSDSWFLHQYVKLEQGKHVRSSSSFLALLQNVPSLRVEKINEQIIGASPINWPKCARFGVYTLIKRELN
jgi:2-polyprenyl-3-methyl-5-hydroxy-6-metoxy-1,4-benzoquinol methylase